MRIQLPAAAVAAAALLTGGCFSSDACTAIGAETGIQVEFAKALREHPREALSAEACVLESCESLRTGRRHRESSLFIGSDVITDDSPVEVRLSITDEHGDVVFEETTTVHPEKLEPNGAGCPPTAWVGHVIARDHELKARDMQLD